MDICGLMYNIDTYVYARAHARVQKKNIDEKKIHEKREAHSE